MRDVLEKGEKNDKKNFNKFAFTNVSSKVVFAYQNLKL
jgi:hypothetical protein